MPSYSEAFKAKMLEKMLPPNNQTAYALWQETGVSAQTLCVWRKRACSVETMPKKRNKKSWTAAEKLSLLGRAENLPDEELSAFLRTEGLHEAQLIEWRDETLEVMSAPRKKKGKKTPEEKEIAALKRELHRKEKALAEAAALLILQKKANDLWGEEGIFTTRRNEE